MDVENFAFHDESLHLVGPDDNGLFTITATNGLRGKRKQDITMQFTHNGLAAIVGCWRAALGEVADHD